jgi:hypothetical protein
MRELALLEVEPGVNHAEVKAESLRQQLKLDLRKPRKFVKFASRCSIQPAINLAHSPIRRPTARRDSAKGPISLTCLRMRAKEAPLNLIQTKERSIRSRLVLSLQEKDCANLMMSTTIDPL